MQIEKHIPDHLDAIVALSLSAWAPVFVSIKNTLDQDLYDEFYPDWRVTQKKAVEDVCADPDTHVWVAILDDKVVGFTAFKQDTESNMGEIYMIGVDPDYQQQGISKALTEFSIKELKNAGMKTAMVETGADPGHAPARRTYEKAGFGLWPAARYFKKL